MGDVCIGYHTFGDLKQSFVKSLLTFVVWDKQNENRLSHIFSKQGLYVAACRNDLVEMFLETDSEWLWMLDCDLAFNPDALYELLKQADPVERPIVAGLYFGYWGKDSDHIHPVWAVQGGDDDFCYIEGFNTYELYPLTYAGTGCLLTHRSVFEKMQQVYESDKWHWFAHDEDWRGFHMGEDVCFGTRARACGFPIYGYTGVVLEHTKNVAVTLDSFTADKVVTELETSDGS